MKSIDNIERLAPILALTLSLNACSSDIVENPKPWELQEVSTESPDMSQADSSPDSPDGFQLDASADSPDLPVPNKCSVEVRSLTQANISVLKGEQNVNSFLFDLIPKEDSVLDTITFEVDTETIDTRLVNKASLYLLNNGDQETLLTSMNTENIPNNSSITFSNIGLQLQKDQFVELVLKFDINPSIPDNTVNSYKTKITKILDCDVDQFSVREVGIEHRGRLRVDMSRSDLNYRELVIEEPEEQRVYSIDTRAEIEDIELKSFTINLYSSDGLIFSDQFRPNIELDTDFGVYTLDQVFPVDPSRLQFQDSRIDFVLKEDRDSDLLVIIDIENLPAGTYQVTASNFEAKGERSGDDVPIYVEGVLQESEVLETTRSFGFTIE